MVSYPGLEELPGPERFQELSICPTVTEGGTSRFDFDATFDSLGRIEPWMDQGQKESARGFRKLGRVFHREFGDELAVYRCETGGPEVHVYFVGIADEHLVGLLTVSIET